jgi:hypothetical protein
MIFRNYKQSILLTILIAGFAYANMQMDAPNDEAESQLIGLHKDWGIKTFHWLMSLFLLVIFPSIAAAFAVANRHSVSLLTQIICAIYSVLEAILMRFEDPNGHENRTSRGTTWFLAFFYCLTIFNGSIAYGSYEFENFLKNSKFKLLLLPFNIITYKIMSCMIVLCGLIKSSMNVIAMLGFCYDSHTGQCNAHGIMGMSFVFYGFILSMVLIIPWLRVNKGPYSQEFYDSTVIMIWGVVNTFTEHRPWEPWSHGDYQHTSMGIIFWCSGLLGMYLSIGRRRNFVPALTLIFTGYAMSEHVQELIISTKVHGFFGYVLMFGGLARVVEISFILDDGDAPRDNIIRSFQYFAPFALILSGILFMGANEEQLQLIVNLGADHSSYILVLSSAACIMFLWILAILRLYLILCRVKIDGNYQELPVNDEFEDVPQLNGEQFQMDDLSDLESHV